MDSDNVNALRDQIAELTLKIILLGGQTEELLDIVQGKGDREWPIPTPHIDIEQERLPPNGPHPPAYPGNCNCQCRSLVRGPNTVGRGVYLGLVSAGDVANLGEHALKDLDDGLRAIVLHLVPRRAGAPAGTLQSGPFQRARDEMIALLNKVSLRVDPLPGAAAPHFASFRNIARGRHLRLADARQGLFAFLSDASRGHALYYETFLQLVQFRGIDIDALP
ncbi:uncharacterized protein H6S33_007151 [Morchella sextelata]|uniref:uncharacterized protein n=1 Tax=Morchella sextelata TaxID=1174677 RepID=UPI001D0432E4|nr:uncharacterized protein H6S33_007151 [Morchella sextelata]KAH0604120.1 hypothetical protein H6S33_007151 [Morchella sextelata]